MVEKYLFKDKKQATAWILSGKVIVDNQSAITSGEKVDENVHIIVKDFDKKCVGKGGLKLESV